MITFQAANVKHRFNIFPYYSISYDLPVVVLDKSTKS